MSFYNTLCSGWILPLGDRLTGQSVMRHLDFFQRSQYWPRERIEAERDRRILDLVRTAYAEVPFYRELYDAHGVGPGDIGGQDDLFRLPPVTKDLLRRAGDRCLRRSGRRACTLSTSGSTGRPFSLRVDAETVSRARALMFLRSICAGYEPGDRMVQTGTAVRRGAVKSV